MPMQLFIRWWSLLLLSFVLTAALTACGAADLPGRSNPTNGPTAQPSDPGHAVIATIAPLPANPVVSPTDASSDNPTSQRSSPSNVIATILSQESGESGEFAESDSPHPTPTATALPTPTPAPSPSPTPVPTVTPQPTATLPPTATLAPTATPAPPPTYPPSTSTPTPPTLTPIPPPTPTTPPAGPSTGIIIECIFFDGLVLRSESDEYVQLLNSSGVEIDLAGWVLQDTADDTPSFVFPNYQLQPGGRIRVYTDEVHHEWGGFAFGRGNSVWNNDEPDTAGLFNPQGQLVSAKSYPPGC